MKSLCWILATGAVGFLLHKLNESKRGEPELWPLLPILLAQLQQVAYTCMHIHLCTMAMISPL